MSGNVDGAKGGQLKKAAAKVDRRIRRTRDTLGDALIALMQEKSFEEITVQEVLDRAGVGRSTFYAHYRDKEDLFLSDVEDFMEMMSTLLTRGAGGRTIRAYYGRAGVLCRDGGFGEGERCAGIGAGIFCAINRGAVTHGRGGNGAGRVESAGPCAGWGSILAAGLVARPPHDRVA